MYQPQNPMETLAAALHAACLRDLPEIQYEDRDWVTHRTQLDSMSPAERKEHYQNEKAGGKLLGPMIQKTRRPTPHDVEVVLFPQVWGSTALGYGGIGGQAMTGAYTVVAICSHTDTAAVYFGDGGRLAYLVPGARVAEGFKEDLLRQIMPGRREAAKKYSIELPDTLRP